MYRSKKPTKTYLAISLPTDEFGFCINLIRHILNPREKWAAHITIRGPYIDNPNVDDFQKNEHIYTILKKEIIMFSEEIKNLKISIQDVNTFNNQVPVLYLNCESQGLINYWWKRDFGYFPHITILESRDEFIFSTVEGLFRSYTFKYDFSPSGIEILTTSAGKNSTLANLDILIHTMQRERKFRKIYEECVVPGKKISSVKRILNKMEKLGYADVLNYNQNPQDYSN